MTFLIPNPTTFRSGGNHYNQQLLRALDKLGLPFTIAHRAADIAPAGPIWVDTLLAEEPLPPGRPRWLIVHHLQSLYPPKGYTSKGYFEEHEASLLRQFNGFLVSSPFTRDYLQRRGLKQDCIVVEPGLDALPPVKERTYGNIRAVTAANLVERKGILPLLEALKANGPWPSFQLCIFGEASLQPAYAERCLATIAELPEGTVSYKGAVPQPEMAAVYQSSNLYISAAFMETYGMSLQEAAAFGLPLLVRRGGNAAHHLEHGKTGNVCDSITELVSCLQGWQQRPAALAKLGANAYARAQQPQRSWKDAARQFWQQYQGRTA